MRRCQPRADENRNDGADITTTSNDPSADEGSEITEDDSTAPPGTATDEAADANQTAPTDVPPGEDAESTEATSASLSHGTPPDEETDEEDDEDTPPGADLPAAEPPIDQADLKYYGWLRQALGGDTPLFRAAWLAEQSAHTPH